MGGKSSINELIKKLRTLGSLTNAKRKTESSFRTPEAIFSIQQIITENLYYQFHTGFLENSYKIITKSGVKYTSFHKIFSEYSRVS